MNKTKYRDNKLWLFYVVLEPRRAWPIRMTKYRQTMAMNIKEDSIIEASSYPIWALKRARERKKTIAHAPHSPFTNMAGEEVLF